MSRDLPPLNGLDLNLLVVLRAVLREQSVTLAAVQLQSTQPTVSRALKRLRDAFQDPLLIRSGRGLRLTPLGEELRVPVEQALAGIDRLTEYGGFRPDTTERTFRLVIPDVIAGPMLSSLATLRSSAPGLSFQIIGSERFALHGLLDDSIDLVYGGRILEHTELYTRQVGLPLQLMVLFGSAHPCWNTEMTTEDWLSSEHVQLVPGEQPTIQSAFDRALSAAGLRRNIRFHISYLAGIAPLLENTALVASLPTHAARWVTKGRELRAVRHPLAHLLEAAPNRLRLTWHQSHHHDVGHRWLREQMVKAVISQQIPPNLNASDPSGESK